MRKVLLILSVLVILLSACMKPLTTEEIVELVLPSLVEVKCSGDKVSNGTGIIISSDGYIITNAHIITLEKGILAKTYELYHEIIIRFPGNTNEYEIEVIDYNLELDLALLKVLGDNINLTPMDFVDNTKLKMGEDAIVMGNALSMGISVTTGVISHPLRMVNNNNYIQTDAATNSGNSGGALINREGLVSGMITVKAAERVGLLGSMYHEGITFAIPSSVIVEYINGLEVDNLALSLN